MSGILGTIDYSDKAAFNEALEMLSPYGGDGTFSSESERVQLGLQYLRIRNDAPILQTIIDNEQLAVVADAIIDNRKALAKLLGCDTVASDSELIANLFNKFGLGLVDYIEGNFAIAILEKTNAKLHLIRDHIGTRPLFWRQNGSQTIFSTDVRALTAFRDLNWEIDEVALARFVMGPNRAPQKALFKHVYEVPPGHRITIDRSAEYATRWWDPKDASDIRYATETEYIDHFRDITERAIKVQADSVRPVGSHISGGFDSSAVTYFARASLKSAYSWSPELNETYPDMGRRDERRKISEICSEICVPVQFNDISGQDFFEFHDRPIEFLGLADLADEIPMLEKAASDKIGLILTGWGGDEAYSAHGYGNIAQHIRRFRWTDALGATYRAAGRSRNPKRFFSTLLHWGIAPLLPDQLYNRFAPFAHIFKNGAFPSAFIKDLAPENANWLGEDVRLIGSPSKYLCSLINMGHLGHRMSSWAAWSAPYKIQYRYPLTHRALLEFVVGIPDEMYTGDGYGRYLPRKAMQNRLPNGLTKQDIASELLRANISIDCWRKMRQEISSNDQNTTSDWIDVAAMKRALEQVPKGFGLKEISLFARASTAFKVLRLENRLRHQSFSAPTN